MSVHNLPNGETYISSTYIGSNALTSGAIVYSNNSGILTSAARNNTDLMNLEDQYQLAIRYFAFFMAWDPDHGPALGDADSTIATLAGRDGYVDASQIKIQF